MKTSLIEKILEQIRKINRRQIIVFLVAMTLVVANGYSIIREFPAIQLITVALAGLYLVFFHADWAMYLVAFTTPFSVIISSKNIHLGLSLPSEALMITLTLIFFARILYDLRIKREFLKHPLSIAIFVYLGWMLLTCLTSVRPVISLKFFASKVWFITSCYWFFMQLVDDDLKNAVRYFNYYALGLAIIVVIVTYQHALSGFDEHYAHYVMSPFYNDHTAYGAALAIYLIYAITYAFIPDIKKTRKILILVVIAVLSIAMILSSCRAAWLSLAAALAVLLCVLFRIKFRWVFATIVVLVGLFITFQAQIIDSLEHNNQDASGDLVENIQSITNISTDASNLERINRWQSAFRLFADRPIFGWGPGTYQFVYAPYQRAKEKTIISTNAGDGGNAHSEFIGPLAEQGFMGTIMMLAFVITVVYTGLKAYGKAKNKKAKVLVLGATLAFFSYFVHGFLNNFLDTDKLAVPIWSCAALIVVIDLYYANQEKFEEIN